MVILCMYGCMRIDVGNISSLQLLSLNIKEPKTKSFYTEHLKKNSHFIFKINTFLNEIYYS